MNYVLDKQKQIESQIKMIQMQQEITECQFQSKKQVFTDLMDKANKDLEMKKVELEKAISSQLKSIKDQVAGQQDICQVIEKQNRIVIEQNSKVQF